MHSIGAFVRVFGLLVITGVLATPWIGINSARADFTPSIPNVPYVDYGNAYKNPNDQSMNKVDIFAPSNTGGQPAAAVIVFHGGSFVSGDKTDMADVAAWLATQGFVVFNANYRLANQNNPSAGYPYPAAYQDAEILVQWIRNGAAQLGVDPARIASLGVSSGATVAAHLGVLSGGPNQVNAVVDISGRMDFTRTPVGEDPRPAFLPNGNYAEASPINHVDSATAPFFIIHGVNDQQVEIAHSRLMLAKLTQAGVQNCQLVEAPTDHMGIIPWLMAQKPAGLITFLNSMSQF